MCSENAPLKEIEERTRVGEHNMNVSYHGAKKITYGMLEFPFGGCNGC